MSEQADAAEATSVVFMYDRHATKATGMLRVRMDTCTAYMDKQGWSGGGRWLDIDSDALSSDRRPAFESMLRSILATPQTVPRVVLVHDWDRFSHNPDDVNLFTRRILRLGASVETCAGDRRTADGRYTTCGRPVSGPVPA